MLIRPVSRIETDRIVSHKCDYPTFQIVSGRDKCLMLTLVKCGSFCSFVPIIYSIGIIYLFKL